MVIFTDLPLEIKLLIIEKDPPDLGKLLLVDKEIYNFYISEHGRNWYKRISYTYIDTPLEKGILRFNTFKDGNWQYYDAGNLRKSNMYRFGKLHGIASTFYKRNHTIKNVRVSKKKYINGIKHGECIFYHLTGNIKRRCTFVNGKLDGKFEEYYPNNTLKILENYIDGKLHGECKYKNLEDEMRIAFYDNGILIREENYINKKILTITTYNDKESNTQRFHTSGKLKSVNNYLESVPHGIVINYYECGSIKNKGFYINGKRNGSLEFFSSGGKLEVIKKYIDDRMTESLLFDNGKLSQRIWYKENGWYDRIEHYN